MEPARTPNTLLAHIAQSRTMPRQTQLILFLLIIVQAQQNQLDYLTGAEEHLWEDLNQALRVQQLIELTSMQELTLAQARNAELQTQLRYATDREHDLLRQIAQLHGEYTRLESARRESEMEEYEGQLVPKLLWGFPRLILVHEVISELTVIVLILVLFAYDTVTEKLANWWKNRPRPIKALHDWWTFSPLTYPVRERINEWKIRHGYVWDPARKKLVRPPRPSSFWLGFQSWLAERYDLEPRNSPTWLNRILRWFWIIYVAALLLVVLACVLSWLEIYPPKSAPTPQQLRPTIVLPRPTPIGANEDDWPVALPQEPTRPLLPEVPTQPTLEPSVPPLTATPTTDIASGPITQQVWHYRLIDQPVSVLPWGQPVQLDTNRQIFWWDVPDATIEMAYSYPSSLVIVQNLPNSCDWRSWSNGPSDATATYYIQAVRTNADGQIIGVYLSEDERCSHETIYTRRTAK